MMKLFFELIGMIMMFFIICVFISLSILVWKFLW